MRIEQDGRALVIDPGVWSTPQESSGADAVLLTHTHFDHADVDRLRALRVPIYAPRGSALDDVELTGVDAGEAFAAAGFTVRAVGGMHARVLPGESVGSNLGYLIEDLVYHPGDAVHVPEAHVATLLVPLQASWLKTSEAIDFVRAVRPERAIGIHDGQVNERGLDGLNRWLTDRSGTSYRWLAPGTVA